MDSEELERRADRIVQGILRLGLAASVGLLGLGLVLSLARAHDSPLLLVGVVVLVATPAARVLALAIIWVLGRDWRFAAVALLVAAILASSALLGSACGKSSQGQSNGDVATSWARRRSVERIRAWSAAKRPHFCGSSGENSRANAAMTAGRGRRMGGIA